jgi:hypothetical protein
MNVNEKLEYEAAMDRLRRDIEAERNEVEGDYSNLIFLCEEMLSARDASNECSEKLSEAIEAIREHVSPRPGPLAEALRRACLILGHVIECGLACEADEVHPDYIKETFDMIHRIIYPKKEDQWKGP